MADSGAQSGLSRNPPVIAVIAGHAIERAARHLRIRRPMGDFAAINVISRDTSNALLA
jgi:hypothetical protein